jgi:hypothetical protein
MRPIIPRTELTPIVSLPALYNPRDLALIRRTVASGTTDDEFALRPLPPRLLWYPFSWRDLHRRDADSVG